MTDREEASTARIEATRRVVRKALDLCYGRGGATTEEATIGVLYAAFDAAELHAGEGVAAVEWLRTACDVLEQGVMDGKYRRPN